MKNKRRVKKRHSRATERKALEKEQVKSFLKHDTRKSKTKYKKEKEKCHSKKRHKQTHIHARTYTRAHKENNTHSSVVWTAECLNSNSLS